MTQPLLLALAAFFCACRSSAEVVADAPAAPASIAVLESAPDAAQKQQPAAKPASQSARAPTRLRLEYLADPLGLDERKPRFSFELDDARRGAVQLGWQILVAKDKADLDGAHAALWDSGKVETADTCQIVYGGPELQAWTHYWWKVRSWDGANEPTPWSAPAHFSTGALIGTDWKSKWIEDPAPAPEPPFVPDTAEAPVTPVAESGAPNRGWCSKFADKEDDYKWIKFDLGKGAYFDAVRLYPANDDDAANTKRALFPKMIKLWGSAYPGFDSISRVFRVDHEGEFECTLPESGPLEIRTGSRMQMQYLLVGFYKLSKDPQRGYAAALAEAEVLDGSVVVSSGKEVWSSDSREENGWSTKSLNDGVYLSSTGAPDTGAPNHAAGGGAAASAPSSVELPRQPLLRHEFAVGPALARATLSCSALGLCDVHLNGKRVTPDVLAPGWSDYRKRVVYDTYDVTALLAAGPNAIGVQLADGWYAGRVGLAQIFVGGPLRGLYGRKPAFMAQLELEYADGHRETIISDKDWKSTLEGPLLSSDLIDGESWDARKEIAGWDKPGFDDKNWTPVEYATTKTSLNAQRGTPVRVVDELTPVEVKPLGPNRWLFDFGRNVSGWCKLAASAPAGSELVLRHGEAKNADGSLYTDNLRSAKQTDHYVFKGGGEEHFEPRFTTHGFRYVEASFAGAAANAKLAQPQLTAEVVSNVAELSGSFHVQHPVLSKLWENIGTTLRANITSLPSDCPQRDERLGWMGDIQVFAPTALFHSDLAAFFTQWLQPVRDGFASPYRFSDFSPNPFESETEFMGAPGWADAGVLVPYEVWKSYGDRRQIEITLPMATRWLEFISSKNPDFLWKEERGNDYGDWLNGSMIDAPGWNKEGCEMPKEVFATAFWAHSADLTSEMAAAIGKNDVAERYVQMAEKVRSAFQKAYIKSDGTIEGDTQAGYALALAFDLVPKNLVPRVQAKLSVSITEKRAWHMTTGMQTTGRMLLELSRRGYEEVASRLARSKEFPSWGWQIEQGATSIWERWDGVYPGRGFADPSMNSFNHYAFGAVGEWLTTCIAGIESDSDNPGYAHFFLHPRAGLQIPGAGARYHSIRGTIESNWHIEGDNFVLDATIPPNTWATVVLPALSVESVREGGKPALESAPNVRPLDYAKGLPGAEIAGRASFEVRAGTYHFESQFRIPAPK